MGTISSSTGLISGLDYESLISQLMEIEKQSLYQLQGRVTETQTQQTAYTQVNALLLAAQSAIHQLAQPSSFLGKTATSSDESILTVSASSSASIDSFSFTVQSLATTHRLVSAGFADSDETPIGAGVLTFANASASVQPSTPLAMLDGFSGIKGGIIRITDRSGATAEIDLRAATTLDDVLDAINLEADINVQASIENGRVVIRDETGSTGNLVISDRQGGELAGGLGIAGTYASGEVFGNDNLIYLTEETRLSVLNDNRGVRVDGLSADMQLERDGQQLFDVNLSGNLRFSTKLAELNDGGGIRGNAEDQRIIRITNRKGDVQEIDLTNAETLQDVSDAIQGAGLSVSISLSGGHLILTDSTGGTASHLIVEDVEGQAAADLGIEGDVEEDVISGSNVYRVDTLGAVIRAIELADGNDGQVSAAISEDGKGIVLTDNTGSGGLAVSALNGSLAAYDLGLFGSREDTTRVFEGNTVESRQIIAGLNTVLLSSLNGGAGVSTGLMTFNLRDGSSVTIDCSDAEELADIMDAINQAGVGLVAEVTSGATGISVADTTVGDHAFSVSGETADDLHLTSAGDGVLISGSLSFQYISENTKLADLHHGDGIGLGSFQMTDSAGATAVIKLGTGSYETIGDIIDEINGRSIGVVASLNNTGDGIKLVDTAGGTGSLTVKDLSNGTTAADLGIAGTADGAEITGRFSSVIEIDNDDTLQDLADKINDADIGIQASIINDGTDFSPYRLTLTSDYAGLDGQMIFDVGSTGITLDTLAEASDAVVLIGDPNSTHSIVITSETNTIDDVINGVTLNLVGTSDRAVSVSITQDEEAIVSKVTAFIDAFNEAMDTINELMAYDSDTGQKGVLLGSSTLQNIESSLSNVVSMSLAKEGLDYQYLSSIGIYVVSTETGGLHLTLERTLTDGTVIDGEAKLREAIRENPEGVQDLFSLLVTDEDGEVVSQGIARQLEDLLERITNSVDGTLTRQNNTLQERVDLYNNRIEDMEKLLERKEERYYTQFQALESALAELQSQQSALSSLITTTSD